MKVLVTGASGFIGSAFVRRACRGDINTGIHSLVAMYRHTASKNLKRLETAVHTTYINYETINADLLGDISGICEGIDAVVNFAARTFVDHSIRDVVPFLKTNVEGTVRLLEDARRHKVKRFIQISTDEVYGSILEGAYDENSRLNPTNPYAASKAAADAFVISYAHTYGMHTTVTRTENNYGPWQHPQKVFPTFVGKLINKKLLPVYGDGQHVRQWLWVDDHVAAIIKLLNSDYEPGQVFHVAGNQELTNLELARRIIRAYYGHDNGWERHIEYIPDHDIRPGHDRRYALKCDKMKALGWQPKVSLDEGIKNAVDWYDITRWWLK